MKFQFSPALLDAVAHAGVFACGVVLGMVLVTAIFGRVYCACFCPLGILQDAAAFLCRRPGRRTGNCAAVRYLAAALVYGALAAGSAAGFLLLDPYSISGRAFSGAAAGGLILPVLILLAALWRRRLYCTALCPAGTLLGLISRFAVFRIRIDNRCVKCGKCVKVCASGCIDIASGTVDNERCVRCMNCLAACPTGSIGFRRVLPGKGDTAVPVDLSRRRLLINFGVIAAGAAVGVGLVRAGAKKISAFAAKFRILPPGAGDAVRFAARCTSCQLCTVNCPAHIIVAAPGGAGPVSLDLSKGACRFDCNRCSQVCPTGAIMPLELKRKQRTRIAEAAFDPRKCMVFQEGIPCGQCAGVCPTGAIVLRRNGTPRPVKTALCIGCGACQAVCPVPEKAMTVHEIPRQTEIEGEES